MVNDLTALIPRHKSDIKRAEKAIEAGYPAVARILPDLLMWLQDYNWPVAQSLLPFLASIGEPLIPEVKRILQSSDAMWKYWILTLLVAKSRPIAAALRDELTQIIAAPTREEDEEEVQNVAREILNGMG